MGDRPLPAVSITFPNASAFDAWLRLRATLDTEQLNPTSGDDGVGLITVVQGAEAVTFGGTAGMTRIVRDGRDLRSLYRLDDATLVWWDYQSGLVSTVAADDPRVTFRPDKEHAPVAEKQKHPFNMVVNLDGEEHSLLVADDPALLSDEDFADELEMSGGEPEVNVLFARLREDRQRGLVTEGDPLDVFKVMTRAIGANEVRAIVAGKTDKPGGVDPAFWIKADKNSRSEYLIGHLPLSLFVENEEGDLYDGTVNRERATAYAQREGEMPPVIAVIPRRRDKTGKLLVNDGKLRILDGGHRISAARMRGDATLPTIISFKPEREKALEFTITVDGVVRPVTNSAGSPIAATPDGLQAFWRWYGDSRLVDDKGRPVLQYHGTAADFDVFDEKSIGSATDTGLFDKGFYFTPKHGNGTKHWGTAGAYAAGPSGSIIPAYIRLMNPIVVPSAKWGKVEVDRSKYDGVIVEEAARGQRGPVVEVVAFKPEQIKSAIANNAFDPENPDIRFSRQIDAPEVLQADTAIALPVITVDGIVRPVTNSAGAPIAGSDALQEKFWRWFGDSNAVDTLGRPVPMYHGTNAEFEKFLASDDGIFFSDNEFYAAEYGGTVMAAYVKTTKPYNTTAELLDAGEGLIAREVYGYGHDSYVVAYADSRDIAVFDPDNIRPVALTDSMFEPSITVDGTVRPITNTDGAQIAATPEALAAFWRWFGDSQVVDGQGRPAVMYHGTNAQFNAFMMNAGTRSKMVSDWPAAYFSNQQDSAAGIARMVTATEGGAPNVMAVYLKADRPAKFGDHATIEDAKAHGFDSRLTQSGGNDVIEWAVFSPTQVKSADINVGTFDPEDPDIRFSRQFESAVTELDDASFARPTVNSLGNPLGATPEAIDAFWQWFGESNAVDELGRPLVVYHGTGYAFDKFDFSYLSRDSDHPTANFGYFFSGPGTASDFAEFTASGEDGANVLPVYLRVINAHDMAAQKFGALVGDLGVGGKEIRAMRERLKVDGHDGIFVAADTNSPMKELHEPNWIVFSPEQIKSATANIGSFDPNNPDIRFSRQLYSVEALRTLRDEDLTEEDRAGLVRMFIDDVTAYASAHNVHAEMRDAPFDIVGDVELTDLYANDPGQGNGTLVMRRLIELADHAGINLVLKPAEPRNREFYARFGFEKSSRHFGMMVRYTPFDLDDAVVEATLPQKIVVDGRTRPVTNSEGVPIAATPEALHAFWRWFGNSKTVDEKGRPKIVYHGTGRQFTEFLPLWKQHLGMPWMQIEEGGRDHAYHVKAKAEPEIYYFAEDLDLAQSYANQFENGRVIAAYLKSHESIKAGHRDTALDEMLSRPTVDSAHFRDTNSRGLGGGLTWAVRRPTQIMQTNMNVGTFNIDNPDIRFSRQLVVDPVMVRPATNSAGFPLGATPEAVQAFWQWFGDSQALDREGRPLVVYRGDRPNQTDFTEPKDSGNYIQGNIFFSSNPNVAKFYTKHRTDWRITPEQLNTQEGFYAAYVRAQNPLVLDAGGESWIAIPLEGKLKKSLGWYAGTAQIDAIAEYANKKGYDSLIVKDVMDQGGEGDQYVVFKSEQVKSIANIGTFDPENPDIRFSRTVEHCGADDNEIPRPVDPVIAYHGTRDDFTEFELGRETENSCVFGKYNVKRHGIFFSSELPFAQKFATKNGALDNASRVIKARLHFVKPLDLTEGFPNDFYLAARHVLSTNNLTCYGPHDMWELFDDGMPGGEEFRDLVKVLGYDSVKMVERTDDGSLTEVWVALSADQVEIVAHNIARHFHVTPASNLPSIQRQGLLPRIGERSAQLAEPIPAIYLFATEDAVADACQNWLGDCFGEDVALAVLAVEIDASAPRGAGAGYEAVISEAISPDAISLLSDDIMNELHFSTILSGQRVTMPLERALLSGTLASAANDLSM